jgi:hypothetical protein
MNFILFLEKNKTALNNKKARPFNSISTYALSSFQNDNHHEYLIKGLDKNASPVAIIEFSQKYLSFITMARDIKSPVSNPTIHALEGKKI